MASKQSASSSDVLPNFSLEDAVRHHPDDLFTSAQITVIGIDEAGRGPWAGPVTAAAAWINPDALDQLPKGLNDSKKMSAQKRAGLFAALSALPQDIFQYAVSSSTAFIIDQIGILPATFNAMDAAAFALKPNPDHALTVLVDGNLAPPFPKLSHHIHEPLKVMPIVKGDARSLSIAAASIMAKETRDAVMKSLHQDHPGYGWDSNMGYGTAEHRRGLAKQGPTHQHRLTYKPVAITATQFGFTR